MTPGPSSSRGPWFVRGFRSRGPCWSQQSIWVAVYCQALASDSGPRLSGNGGEGRGSTRGADSGVISDPESSAASHRRSVCVRLCVGVMAALLGCPEPKGLSRLQRSGIWAGKGRVVRASGDHAEHKRWRHSARVPCRSCVCYLAEQGLPSDILGALWCQEVMPGTAHSFH